MSDSDLRKKPSLVRLAQTRAGRAPRLLLVPPAGAGLSFWQRFARGHIDGWSEVLAVSPPGRENRIAEPFYESLDPYISDIVEALPNDDMPLIVFGHSLGGLVAFRVANELAANNRRAPDHVFISSRMAPHATAARRWHEKSPSDFMVLIRGLGGTPPEVFEHEDLWNLYAGALRADFKLAESWRPARRAHIDAPITVLGGIDDPTTNPKGLASWADYTSSSTTVRLFEGNHFFLFDHWPKIFEMMSEAITEEVGT